MGNKSPEQTTVTNAPPPILNNFYDYISGQVQPLIGTGQLNPRLPDGWQINAPLDPSVSGANTNIQNYLNGGQYQGAQNDMFANLANLGQGNTPGNPLSNSGQFGQNQMQDTLMMLMQGGIPGGNMGGLPGQQGHQLNFNGGSTGGLGGTGTSSWSSGPAGGYDPMTNSDIQGQIDATADDLTRALQRGGLRDIRMDAVAEGGLGGSRQGVREGVAEEGLGRAILTESARIRNEADNNERNRLAQLAATNMQTGASANAAGASAQAQLAIAQMNNQLNWGQLLSGNALGAANANQGLMNSGYGYGLDALRGALGAAPSIMQSPIANQLAGAGLGMDITNFNQTGMDRNTQAWLQNNSTLLNDLNSFSGLIFGSNPGQFASQTTTGPSTSRFGSAVGGMMAGYGATGGSGWGSSLGFLSGLFG